MARQPTEPSLKELREQLERAQIQAELERLSEPRPEYGSVQALKTPRVFVLRTVATISDADLEKMSKKLSDTYGDKVVVIRIDSDDQLYSL